MQDFLNFLITPLLLKPEELVITMHNYSASIKVSPEDAGRVIGKHGIVISSLRNLCRTYCLSHNLNPVNLSLEN